MTIQDFGSIAEVVGAVATVATLAYLAIQIRANTRMMRAQAMRAALSDNAQFSMAIAQSPQLADVFDRGLASFESLTASERWQFTMVFSQIVGVLEGVYNDAKFGIVDQAHLERSTTAMSLLLQTPGGKSYWRVFSAQGAYSEEFRSFVDSKLDDKSRPTPGNASK